MLENTKYLFAHNSPRTQTCIQHLVNQNRFEWDLIPPHSSFGVHVPAVSESLPSRQRWVARPCSRGGKQRRGNFIEMAEGATTLKGLRAQMGKLKTGKKNFIKCGAEFCHRAEFSLCNLCRQVAPAAGFLLERVVTAASSRGYRR